MKAAWIICGVLVVGLLIGWMSTRDGGKPVAAQSAIESKGPPVVWSGPRKMARGEILSSPPAMNAAAEEPSTMTASTNWQDQVGELLVADLDDSEKARQILELFPNLPEEGQVQVAEQLSFTLGDEEYPLLARFLTSGTLPEPVLEALLTGTLVRSDEIRAPILLAVATDERHPKAEEARSMLSELIGTELAGDPRLWPALVQGWLQSNPTPRPPL